MPRYRHRTMRRPRAPKPPKPPRIKRPSIRDLRQIYSSLISTDIGQRIASLNTAMQWYDSQALPYVIFKNQGEYTTEQAKDMDVASKCRLKGMSTHSNHEKETAYRQALKRYEKVCHVLEPLKVDSYYTDLAGQATRLEAKEAKLEERFGNTAQLLTKALSPENIQGHSIDIRVGPVKEQFQMDPERSKLTLSRSFVKELKQRMRTEGLLPVATTLIQGPLSKIAALRPEYDATGNPTGKYVMTHQDRFHIAMKMMENLITFCRTAADAPKRLVKVQVAALPGQPRTKRAGPPGHAFGRKGNRIADSFMAGTIIATLYIKVADGQWHSYQELRDAIRANQSTLISKMRWIDGVGKKKTSQGQEGWSVEFGQDRARVVFSSETYQKQVMSQATAATSAP